MSGADDTHDADAAAPVLAPAASAKPRRSRLSRWLRRAAFSIVGLLLLVALGLWIATRSWFIIWQVQPVLERKLGGEVTIARAEYDGGGRVTFHDVNLRARGLQGPAAEIATIGRCFVNVGLAELLTGRLTVEDVELSDVTVRLSESAREGGLMNFQSLKPQQGTSDKPLPTPPRVRIQNLLLEVGVHDGASFIANGRRRMGGEMEPIAGQEGWFVFDLREVNDRGHGLGPGGLLIKGEWNARTLETHSSIEGIALDERVFSMLPQQARLAWNQMKLEGRVNNVSVDWQPDSPLTVEFSVKDVALTLPVDLQEMWSLYRNGAVEETTGRPRKNVHSGEIRVGTDSLTLDGLTGEVLNVQSDGGDENVVGVPYQISLSVPALPEIKWDAPERWMEEALKTAAFEADISLEGFSMKSDAVETQAVGLPTIVARTLAKFQTTGWVLSTSVHVSRGDPLPDTDGSLKAAPLAMTGQAYINKAKGKYHKFPYLLDDVYAYLHFDTQRVVVEYLNGRGSGGATFQIKGAIELPDKDPAFRMQVTGLNVPLDDRFRAALKPVELKAVEALFNQSSADSMQRAGLLPDAAMLQRQQAERDEASLALSQMKRAPDANAAAIVALEQRIAQLDRSIAADPFVAGATVNIDLTVSRDVGPQQPTQIGGVIDILSGGLIYDRFPYPLRASAGRLIWGSDRVDIDPGPAGTGLSFVTPSGGIGLVSGSIAFPNVDGSRKVRPDLTFAIEDDPANETVCAAIPYSKGELAEHPDLERVWPGLAKSRAGRMVQGIGLAGVFDYHGRVNTREDGKMAWDFSVSLDGGTAQPNTLLSKEINARDMPWPVGFTLSGLKGDVRVRREGVNWEQISGSSGDATLSTSGLIDLREDGDPDFVTVRLANAPADRSALNMVSSGAAPRAEAMWDQFQPQGRYDALVTYRSDGPAAQTATVTIEPRDVTLLAGGERVRVQSRQGALRIDRQQASFDDLSVDLSVAGAPRPEGAEDIAAAADTANGTLGIRGAWTFAGEKPAIDLAGDWRGGRFESPIIPEMLRTFDQRAQADRFREFAPSGQFDMSFRVERRQPDAPADYRFDLQPKAVEFTLRNTRVGLLTESGRVSVTPGFITVDHVVGTSGNGADEARFSVDGGIKTTDPLDATLSIDYEGRLRSKEVAAFLPSAVNGALAALEFRDRGRTRLDDGWLHVRKSEGAGDGWQTEFTGRVAKLGAEFVAVLHFSEVDGWLDLDVSHETGRPPRLTAVSRADRAVVLGKVLTGLEAPMSFNEAGDALEIPTAQARSGDGAITASVTAGVGDRRDYSIRVDLVGVPLGSLLVSSAARPPPDGSLQAAVDAAPDTQPPPAGAGGPVKPVTGQVYASLSLNGLRGDPRSKRGRGVFRVLNGHLSSIPLLLQAVQVMQLTLPLSGGLDFADAEFYVLGDTAHFEHILFESTVGTSAALQLMGEGTLDLDTMEVAARFRPRSGIAILRDIIGGIGDMFYEIEVTGPVREPQARIVPLP